MGTVCEQIDFSERITNLINSHIGGGYEVSYIERFLKSVDTPTKSYQLEHVMGTDSIKVSDWSVGLEASDPAVSEVILFEYLKKGKTVAFAILYVDVYYDINFDNRSASTVWDIYVEEEYRKMGIGRRLTEEMAKVSIGYKCVLMCKVPEKNIPTKGMPTEYAKDYSFETLRNYFEYIFGKAYLTLK